MYKKLLFLSIFLSFLGFTAKAQDNWEWTGDKKFGSWENDTQSFNSVNLSFLDGHGACITVDIDSDNFGDCKLIFKTTGWSTVEISKSENGERQNDNAIKYTYKTTDKIYLDQTNASQIKNGFYLTCNNIKISRILIEPYDVDPDQPDPDGPTVYTDTILDGINAEIKWTEDGFWLIKLNQTLSAGDKLTFKGNYGYDPQLQFRSIDGNNKQTTVGSDYKDNPVVVTIDADNVDLYNTYGFVIKGQNITVTEIYYEGANPIQKGGSASIAPKKEDPDQPDQPGETYEGVLFDNPNGKDGCLDLWINWNQDDNQYEVIFNQRFSEGDQLIFNLCETYSGQIQIREAANHDNHLLEQEHWNMNDNGSNPNPASVTLNITPDNVNIVNTAIVISGYNYKVHSIYYKGKNELVSGGTIKDLNGDVKYGEVVYEYDQERVQSMMDVVEELSYINPHWKDGVTVTKSDDGVITVTTTYDNRGFGIMAQALSKAKAANKTLDNSLYNGNDYELSDDGYGANTHALKGTEEGRDPLLDFYHYEKVVIELAEPVAGAKVYVYYRDLEWDNYTDPNVEDELPETKTFNSSTSTFEVELTPFRYVRAIGLRFPSAGTYTVKNFFLYEYEKYQELKAKTDDPNNFDYKKDMKLPVEVWTPSNLDEEALFEGVHMGTKQFYEQTDDHAWQAAEENGKLAWTQAIEIPGEVMEKCVPRNTPIPFHSFAIVYKNAHEVEATENIDRTAEGQLQVYVNFPYYRTGSEGFNYAYWKDKEWYEEGETTPDGEPDDYYNDHKLFYYVNREHADKAKNDDSGTLQDGIDILYTPNVRASHTIKSPGANQSIFAGSVYLSIPTEKHTIYTYGKVVVDASADITYPTYPGDKPLPRKKAYGDPDVESSTDYFAHQLAVNGMAIRGQNVSIMKVVYLGNTLLDDPTLRTDENLKQDEQFTGIEEIVIDNNDYAAEEPAVVNVYNLQGMTVRHGVARENALDGLTSGIYIVNGKKVWVK